MKKGFRKQTVQRAIVASILLISSLWVVSCKDEYLYDNKEPEWLGASIYDYLKNDGNFDTYVKLIDDVGYTSVLAKTGSKTLFVADDAAFDRFFQNNPWGVSSYSDLSLTQKKLILNFGMINNAYLMETLANFYNGSLVFDKALRRETAISVIDTIPFESGNMLPKGSLWDSHRSKGMYLLKDATSWPIVYFLQGTMDVDGITNDDFKLITGEDRQENDAHVFNDKVVQRDITCKNGYIQVLENVLIPPVNIAEHLREDPNTTIFSGLLDRYSAPYYNGSETQAYNQIHPDHQIDSIYEKRYFSQNNNGATFYPNGKSINSELLLPYNPGNNSYVNPSTGAALQEDMAAILAPTDAAMEAYFQTGSGIVLKERYGSWDNVPNDIVALLLKRHMRTSFIATVPSRFDKLTDSENSPIVISPSDVTASYVGVNGVVYETSKVYPPDDYVSVYGPVLFSEKTRVFNWAIRQNDFRLYLNSLVSHYSFFVPTDKFFTNYIDPLAYAKDVKAALKYWYNTKTSTVNATVYSFDATTGEVGDSLAVITSESFLSNRLQDLLDSHIVIGDVESGSKYYFTKNGNSLKIEGSGTNLTVQGGDDIEKGKEAHVIPNGVFEQQNGNTYFIDKPIQTPLRSVYSILSTTPEFNKFFQLLVGFNGTSSEIFVKKKNYYGVDYSIKFFNTFNYTVYVPTNDAIQKAIDDGVIQDWDQINAIEGGTAKAAAISKLERFVRYHFQDNSIFISGDPVDKLYQTATIKTDDKPSQFGTYKDKYFKLGISGDGSNLELKTEAYGTAKVVKDNGLYNIMARDYIFSDNPQAYKEIDGTGSGKDFTSSSITTSSTAVIHQIDNVLRFE
ncbi:MAG TPA: hypothetical protein VKA27_10320 [Sunxiuqinia sp.]|nr:hypothetical protein [Sunxiuqinia sp.]